MSEITSAGNDPDGTHEQGAPAVSQEDANIPVAKKKKKDKKKDVLGGLGTSRGIETMFRTSYRVHMDLTALADNKANMMISINGLILSIIIAAIAPKIDSNPWLLVPTTLMLAGCLSAIILAVLAARPRVYARRIKFEDVESGDANLLFFGNSTQLEEGEYIKGMVGLVQNTDLLYTNMMRDLYGLGSVLSKKFEYLRRSYTVFMFGLTISVLAFILVFVLRTLVPEMFLIE